LDRCGLIEWCTGPDAGAPVGGNCIDPARVGVPLSGPVELASAAVGRFVITLSSTFAEKVVGRVRW
jgi:hypothetical protein